MVLRRMVRQRAHLMRHWCDHSYRLPCAFRRSSPLVYRRILLLPISRRWTARRAVTLVRIPYYTPFVCLVRCTVPYWLSLFAAFALPHSYRMPFGNVAHTTSATTHTTRTFAAVPSLRGTQTRPRLLRLPRRAATLVYLLVRYAAHWMTLPSAAAGHLPVLQTG